jgi:phage terminase large subunit
MANKGRVKEIALAYEPREQFLPFHRREQRWSCMVCHRRAGKTVSCVNELVIRALYTTKKNARFAYIAPTFSMAKDIAWVYLKEAVEDFALEMRESELRVKLPNGAWITLYGSDTPDRLRGLYFDGVVLDEFGDCRPSLWGEIILATLIDRRGWAVFIGTPKGRNHFYDIYLRSQKEEDWFTLTLKARSAGILDQDQIDTMFAEMSKEEFQQEMECSFTAAVKGTYYAEQIETLETMGRIGHGACSYDPTQKVLVSSDLGFSDSTAFWFWQPRPDGLAIIDYEEAQGKNLKYYIDLLNNKGYDYERIWLPHDARAKTLQTGRSTIEQFLEAGFPAAIVPRLGVQDGINAVRLMLERCWIDAANCYYGIEALRAYRRSYNEIKKAFTNNPDHNWASDGADAFRYLALVASEKATGSDAEKAAPSAAALPFKAPQMTLDEMYAEKERGSRRFEKLRI